MKKKKVENINDELIKIAIKLKKYLRRDKIIIYIFSLLSYRYLSEKIEITINKSIDQSIISYEEAWREEKFKTKIKQYLLDNLGYVIEPQNLFSEIIKSIKNNKFKIENLEAALNNVNIFFTEKSEGVFKDLFRGLEFNIDISINDQEGCKAMVEDILKQISLLDIEMDSELENSYYKICNNLIDYFEDKAKKEDEHLFTPKEISEILNNLVESDNICDKIYDPVCGIGSLLTIDTLNRKIYGQEKEYNYYNLAKMSLLLQGVDYENFDIKLGDIFENPGHEDEKFKAIISNLVYCRSWNDDLKYFSDSRFIEFPKLPPKSKAEYAFIEHMIYQLDQDGKMAVLVSHGVLFRGANEAQIRKYLIKEKNYLDGVIGLPSNLLSNTTIPVAIMIFKKGRNKNQNIMFIDASNEYRKGKKRNSLSTNEMKKILSAYNERKTIDKYSREISVDEIEKNDFNLNIPRYIETLDEEEEIDINKIRLELNQLNEEILSIDKEIEQCLKELEV